VSTAEMEWSGPKSHERESKNEEQSAEVMQRERRSQK